MNILTLIIIFLTIIIVSAFIIFFDKFNLTAKVTVITVFLGISCLIIAFLPFGFFSKDITNNINSTLIGFGTGLILTAVTISFIQYFLDLQKIKIKEEIERKQEIDHLIKTDRIMTILINEYIIFFNCVVLPFEKRINNDDFSQLKLDFKFKDMTHLFFSSLYLKAYSTKSSIELFYEYENKIRNLMINLIGKNNLNHHNEILKIFTNFITISLKNDFSNSILNSSKNKKLIPIISDLIATYKESNLEDKNFKHQDLILPYIHLYNLLKEEGKLIIQYQNEIKKIKKLEEGS